MKGRNDDTLIHGERTRDKYRSNFTFPLSDILSIVVADVVRRSAIRACSLVGGGGGGGVKDGGSKARRTANEISHQAGVGSFRTFRRNGSIEHIGPAHGCVVCLRMHVMLVRMRNFYEA